MRRGLTYRLMRALLGRLHGWSGAVLGRLDGAVAVAEEPAPVPGGPPAHWLERVRIQAPWFLERIGSFTDAPRLSRAQESPAPARMARKPAVDAVRPPPGVAATVGDDPARSRVAAADAARRESPMVRGDHAPTERSGAAAAAAAGSTASARTADATAETDTAVSVSAVRTPTRLAMPASAPAPTNAQQLRIRPASAEPSRTEPGSAETDRGPQPTIARGRSPEPRQVVALRVREPAPDLTVPTPPRRGAVVAAIPTTDPRPAVAQQRMVREAGYGAVSAAQRSSAPAAALPSLRSAPESMPFDVPTRVPRTAPVRAMLPSMAPMAEPARPMRSDREEIEIVWPELPASTLASSAAPERAMPRYTVDPWPELPVDGWEDADARDGEAQQLRVAHQRSLDHEQRGQPWSA